MVGQIPPTNQPAQVLPVDTYPGQKLEGAKDIPRPVVNRKDDILRPVRKFRGKKSKRLQIN